jgi:hypothetical protein
VTMRGSKPVALNAVARAALVRMMAQVLAERRAATSSGDEQWHSTHEAEAGQVASK